MDLHALFKNCGDAVIVADDNYQIIFSNSKAKQLFQADYAVLLTATIDSACRLLHVDPKTETKEIACPLRQAVDGEQCCDREFQFQTPTSTSDIWLSITSFPIQMTEPSWRGGLVIIRDITKLKHVAHQKLRNALRDELTDLVSRAAFMDRVGHALKRIQHEADFLVAVLCVDINRLRSINDALGYEAGDQLLVQFATRLTRCFRSEDIVSRLGGDEFTILLEGVSSSLEAMDFARKIHRIMAQSFYLSGTEIPVEVSIGIAFGGIDCQHPEVLLKRANLAMYEAKRDFGERCCIFESSMQGDTPGLLHLEMALRKAITNHEFFLEYQPIFQVTTRQIIGLESLVRWHHPQEGKLPPSQFIPLAEKTGLIVPLGWWILKESCRQMKIWQNQMPYMDSFFVSVNMSSKQFSQEDVVQRIAAILEEVGLDARSLKIEITEGVLIEHSSSIIEKLQAIRDLGITLSIDDFGTGYSS
ncbi:MAG: EAL domain-containing protein, partial [Cyanobacteria bacterium P01_D01_bin.56]